jgi:hypothetical protein
VFATIQSGFLFQKKLIMYFLTEIMHVRLPKKTKPAHAGNPGANSQVAENDSRPYPLDEPEQRTL